jgi:hypothetical protein
VAKDRPKKDKQGDIHYFVSISVGSVSFLLVDCHRPGYFKLLICFPYCCMCHPVYKGDLVISSAGGNSK